MRIAKIQRVSQSARILPIHVKEGDIRGKSTSFLNYRKRQAKVTRINKISYLFSLIKRGLGPGDDVCVCQMEHTTLIDVVAFDLLC